MLLPKIFADFNIRDSEGRVRFTEGSFNDIERLNITLKSDLEVFLDNNEGLSIKGVVDFSNNESIWVAQYDHENLNDTSVK
jgi:hypothetical protein